MRFLLNKKKLLKLSKLNFKRRSFKSLWISKELWKGNLGRLIIRKIFLERILIDLKIDLFRMNLTVWFLKIKFQGFKDLTM